MKKLSVMLIMALFLSGCASQTPTVSPTPSAQPTVTAPAEDGISKENLLPLHVSVDGILWRVYLSGGKPYKRVITDGFTLNYGGTEHSVIKFFRNEDVLFFGNNYSVKNGEVLCTLNRYSKQVLNSYNNILAQSVTFGNDCLAYISKENGQSKLYFCDLSGETQLIDTDVEPNMAFINGDILYLKNGELYYKELDKNTPQRLGKSGEILQVYSDTVITMASNEVSVFGTADINVFFPAQNKHYIIRDVKVLPRPCINGYVLSDGELYLLQTQGAVYIAKAQYVLPVQGGNGVVFYHGDKTTHCLNDAITVYSLAEPPLEAYYARGRLMIRTSQWLYDGQARIGNPDQVRFLDGELYMMYNNSDGVTATLRKLDGIAPIVTNALADMPFYSIGGKICYFFRQSFTSDDYRLASGDIRFDNIHPYMPIYGNSALSQIAAYNNQNAVIVTASSIRIEFENGKIYL